MTLGIFSTKLFRQEINFVAGASAINQLPKYHLPQIAFVGKSNVGKSRLINTICKRKSLAKVSNTPGRTKQINFFSLADKLILVDLPGYGFAKVAQQQKQNWEKLIMYYLATNDKLQLINLLIDSRRGIQENDLEVIAHLKSLNKKFQIIFTKGDKISSHEFFIKENYLYLSRLGYEDCNMLLTSSKNATGIKELQWSLISAI